MLFLMNEVVLNLAALDLAPPIAARRFAKLDLQFVSQLGAELYSEEPLLQRVAPDRAMRLAALIVAKAPEVNAALFVSPSKGCPHDQVQVRYASIGLEVMGVLYDRQRHGALTTVEADRQVWRRLAA
ncbi:hypothetical protein CSW64_05860 [Caulobacter mirabilis]|uniref:Uncharacterized protein n=2 Tax=Caulobacter mirabilis TaxID=69666 RepID=A0A2D2AVD4_9CAUL|nr:hypothetical protein [Caulobacter mirabilis]ATQ41970.1 hypothetical protein CSW64_05860 [Caulobacter mirabilis]